MSSARWVEDVLAALKLKVIKRKGGRAWLLCPFHEDRKVGNFFVRLEGVRRNADGKQYSAAGQSHCFACGKGGSLADLVAHVRGCSKKEAEAFVKARGAVSTGPRFRRAVVVEEQPQARRRFEMPREVIFEPLAEWVSLARTFAVGRCGITPEEVDAFRIGYAVDGRKLAGRIVLPRIGSDGRFYGYSARTFVDAEPKYTTPDPEDLADDSVLFGEHLWPLLPSDRSVLAVTEGAINGLVVRRAFPELPIGAIEGSELGERRALKLATFRALAILTDPDPAGTKAAKQIERTLGRYARIVRVELPPKKDALDVGPERLRAILGRALDKI